MQCFLRRVYCEADRRKTALCLIRQLSCHLSVVIVLCLNILHPSFCSLDVYCTPKMRTYSLHICLHRSFSSYPSILIFVVVFFFLSVSFFVVVCFSYYQSASFVLDALTDALKNIDVLAFSTTTPPPLFFFFISPALVSFLNIAEESFYSVDKGLNASANIAIVQLACTHGSPHYTMAWRANIGVNSQDISLWINFTRGE